MLTFGRAVNVEIRKQALMNMLQSGCFSREAIIDSLDRFGSKELSNMAKMVQHGNIAHWAHCTESKAGEHQLVQRVSSETEMRLRKVEIASQLCG